MSLSSPKIVFICAAGHSGSTLLNLLLGAHPDGMAVGEITQFPKNLALDSTCSCGSRISRCAFWQPIVDEYGKRLGTDLWSNPYFVDFGPIMAGTEIDTNHQTRGRMIRRKILFAIDYFRLALNLPVVGKLTRSLQRGAEQKLDFLKFVAEQNQRTFVVDSSKHYLDAYHLYRAAPGATRLLILTRDGRAVFHSGLRRGLTPADAMRAWSRPNRRAQRLVAEQLPAESWLPVRYEALAKTPETELSQICDFLEIEFHPDILQFADSDSHVANGNRMRHKRVSKIRFEEKWRDELTGDQLAYFEKHAGKLNRSLGYRD